VTIPPPARYTSLATAARLVAALAYAPSSSGPRPGSSNTAAVTGQPAASERSRTGASGPGGAGGGVVGGEGTETVVAGGAVVAGAVVVTGAGAVVVAGSVLVVATAVDVVVAGVVVPVIGPSAGAVAAPTAKSTTPTAPAISFRDGITLIMSPFSADGG
jgi:hypothetical protein